MSIDEPLNVDWDGNELLAVGYSGHGGGYRFIRIMEAGGREEDSDKDALNLLSARERFHHTDALWYRILLDGEEKTQKEVADLLGISQSYISRLEKKIMVRLRKEMVKYS